MVNIIIASAKTQNFDKNSCYVKFDYDASIVNYIKTLPMRSYDMDTKTWELPSRYLDAMLDFFQANNIHGTIEDMSEEEQPTEDVEVIYKTTPFAHQTEGVLFGMKHNNWFLGDEQGLGKTKQAIDIAVNRKKLYGYKHCLIVCGVNSLKWNWYNEVKIHSDEEPYIIGQRNTKKGKIRIGSTNDKITDVMNIEKLPYFIITNIESFRSMDFAYAVRDACEKDIQMAVLDEAHKCKNPTSQQTKGFLKCNAQCKIAMTGTPIMNSPLDLYIILKWLGYENHSFYSFQNHYCIKGGFGGYEIVGYKNMDQLSAITQEIMLRRLKKEVLDLPDKIYIDEIVEMLPKQGQLYKEILAEIQTNIDKVALSPSPLGALIRLRQCTGYTGILSSELQESAKLDRLEDIIEETVANGNKAIIFSNWTSIVDSVLERLSNKYSCGCITGDTADNERQDIVNEFQTNPNCKFIVGTIGAMGTGLTLTAATTVIFMDEPWNKALFDQAVDRAHRIGTKSNITIYSIICKDTIDERIHDLIYKKGALADCLIDGELTGNKTETINYLLS